MYIRSAWYVALCLALLAFSASAQLPKPRPVQAGQLFKSSYIHIKAPDTGGWFMVDSSQRSMGFARPGLAQGETLAAHVLMFDLTPTQTPEELVALVTEFIRKSHDPQRFDFVEFRTEYTAERRYPCARNYSVLTDKQAVTSPTTTRVLRLEVHALYCRHPVRTDTGFAAVYSHRGYGTYPNLAESAQEFIQGIEVPPAPPASQ